jgi:hypothetical protein
MYIIYSLEYTQVRVYVYYSVGTPVFVVFTFDRRLRYFFPSNSVWLLLKIPVNIRIILFTVCRLYKLYVLVIGVHFSQ